MALHSDFPTSPHVILDLDIRLVLGRMHPARQSVRGI